MPLSDDSGSSLRETASARPRSVLRGTLSVVLAYLVFGALWILLSDRILNWLVPPADLPFWQSLKGLGFIAITALLLFLLVRRQLRRLARALRISRDSEARFRSMFRHTQVAMLEIDQRELMPLLREWQQLGFARCELAIAEQPVRMAQALSRLQVVAANPAARQLFGLKGASDQSRCLRRLFPPEASAQFLQLLQALSDCASRVSMDVTLRDAEDNRRPYQLDAGLPPPDSHQYLVLSLTDISGLRQASARHQLLHDLPNEIAASRSYADAMRLALQRLCETGQWQFGQFWGPSSERDMLICTPIYFGVAERYVAFHQYSLAFAFMPGRGLPGRVWQQRQALWLRDVTLDSNFPRAPFAEQSGFRSAVAVPLRRGEDVVGVLEFFSEDSRREDASLLELMTSSCAQLELAFAMKRQVDALQRSEQQFQQAMTTVGFGFWDWQIATGQVRWQGNVERMFGLTDGSFDGRMASYLALLPDGDREQVEQRINDAINGTDERFDVQHRIRLGDGQQRWLEGRGLVQRDGAGKATALAGVVLDITDTALAERALPALAAATALADPAARCRAVLRALADAFSADDALLCPADATTPVHFWWQTDRWREPQLLSLSSGLRQRLQENPAWHVSAPRQQFDEEWLWVERDCEAALICWLDLREPEQGVLMLLFRRALSQPERMLSLMQLVAPRLLPA